MKKMITMQELANKMGISISTVSRAFSKPEMLDKKRVQSIMKEAHKHGFTPNLNARALATGKTNIIALILPELNYILGDYLSLILCGIESVLDNAGYSLIITSYQHESKKNCDFFEKLNKKVKVDGAIIMTPDINEEQAKKFIKNNNVVFADIKLEQLPSIYTDNFDIGYQSAKILIDHGHKDILSLYGPYEWKNSRLRMMGIEKAYKDANIDLRKIHKIECQYRNGSKDAMNAITKIYKNNSNAPTGIIAGNDDIAAGALKALKILSISVPNKVSIIGCDNSFFSNYLAPELTTIDQYGYELGVKAAEYILSGDKKNLGNHNFDIIERSSISSI